jgi:outer membrane protein assembly factor BamD (BamD/ComL family)
MDSETQKTDTLYELLGWLETNKQRVAVGGGAVLLLVGIVASVVWFKKQGEFRASEALSSIRIPVNPAEPLPPDTLDKLQKLSADYSGTAAATRAELIRAGLLYTSGKYSDAQAAFEKFLRDHPADTWISEAYYGVAVSLDAQNKANEAIAKYEDFTRRFSTDPKVDQARMHLATLLESVGKSAEAYKEYEKIAKATTYTPAQGEAQERLRRLVAKYPNLAPTNPPPTMPVLPSLQRTGVVASVQTNLIPVSNAPVMIKASPAAPTPLPAPAQPK